MVSRAMVLKLVLAGVVVGGGCKKKDEEAEPPPEPINWDAELADVVENNFDELCSLRSSAAEDKATAALQSIDEVATKWKAASLASMRKRTAEAKTEPKLVALFESLYAKAGAPCERPTLSAGVTTTIGANMQGAEGAFVFSRAVDAAAWETGVFSPKVFATMFERVAGSWPKLHALSPGTSGDVTLLVEFRGDGMMSFDGHALPRLTARSRVVIEGADKAVAELAVGDAKAQEGAVRYTKYTNRETGLSNTSEALDQVTKSMLHDVSYQTIDLVSAKLGLSAKSEAWQPIAGEWEQDLTVEPSGTCTEPTGRDLDVATPISVYADRQTVTYKIDEMRAELVDGWVVAMRKEKGRCKHTRDRFDMSVGAGRAKVGWTIYDAACKPCSWGYETPLKKKQ